MTHIIGGYIKNPKLMIDNAINYFEKIYLKRFDFQGVSEENYFLGIIKEKSKKHIKNIKFIDDNNKIFKSLYYHEIPEVLTVKNEWTDNNTDIINLQNDFIYIKYDKNKGIKVFVDKFAREKIYYLIKPPYLFSTSLKFLISNLEKKQINYNALTRFLIAGVLVGKENIFSNINRLDIGEYLHINKKTIQVNKYWNLSKNYFQIPKHDIKDVPFWEEYVYKSLKETVDFPVKRPILSLMSGGLDSTVITSILLKEFEVPLEALTIVIPNYNDEEGYKAAEIAEYLEIPHKISKARLESIDELENFYSEAFNLVEEPMGGTAFFSRYFAFKEVEKTDKQNILMGDGAGEILSYVRDYLINQFKYINYLYYTPIKLRKNFMKFIHKFYEPSLKLPLLSKNKNIINSLEILLNTNFLQANSQFQSLFTSWQWSSLEDLTTITNHKINLETYLAPIRKNVESYPFKDYNKAGYHFLINAINSDSLIAHNLSSFFDLKLYSPYISDVAFQKILPLPPYIKTLGDRGKWIVRQVAKKKKLLPENYFDWKPKYGLRQIFYDNTSFELVKSYVLNLIDSVKGTNFMNIKPFMKFFNKTTLKRLTTHSSEYMKFNIWLGFLGWLSTIE